jgi:hypothetical protein
MEKADAGAIAGASLTRTGLEEEAANAAGMFLAELVRNGDVVWSDEFPNTVTTVGKNLALDTYLAGATYTVTGPFIGLISTTSFSATTAADTMSSHSGWIEAGVTNNPTYTTPRKTVTWSSAGSGTKASTAASFAITGSGTIKGAFLVYGSGAVSTIDSTAGTLYSAGTFTGGDRAVQNGDTLNVTYTASL